MGRRILAVNPGSTSTKIAVYDETRELWRRSLSHRAEDLARFSRLMDQLAFRSSAVQHSLRETGTEGLAAVVGRGGLLKPLSGGVYEVNKAMIADLTSCRYGTHASNLGALIADAIAKENALRAFIVDPVVVDELDSLARYSGVPEIPRRSIFHALNQKATARKAARSLGKAYAECSLVVAHLGGGTSVGVHIGGRVVDVNNALDGEGPLSIERAGTVPAGDWMRYVLSHRGDSQELQLKLTGRGGMVAYLGTNDFQAIEKAALEYEHKGDDGLGQPNADGLDRKLCHELVQAFCYQTAKCIAAMGAVACGKLDAVVLTGGLAFSAIVVEHIRRRIGYLSPVLLFPGENELEALAMGVLEALDGETDIKTYEG